jgi:SAM-dependent methyltransferase
MGRNSLLDWLRIRRRGLEDALTARGKAHTLSLERYRLHRAIAATIAEHAQGDCLDAGSGRSPYKTMLQKYAEQVISIDVEDRSGDTDMLADIQSMPQIHDASFDTILCSQVLEHVPRPWDAMGELARVLRKDGTLILTVPHLSIIHEAPHDYYRYTRFGLAALCEPCGLEIKKIQATGGLGCFILHGISAGLLSTVGGIPLIRWVVFSFNYLILVRLPDLFEQLIGMPQLYPCDYLLVATRVDTGDSD